MHDFSRPLVNNDNVIVDVTLSYKILTDSYYHQVLDDNIFCASRRTVIQHIANEINSIHLVSTYCSSDRLCRLKLNPWYSLENMYSTVIEDTLV